MAVAAALLLAACGSSDAKGDTTTTKAQATTTTTEKATTTTDPKATTTTTSGNVDALDGAFVSSAVAGYELAPDSELTFTFDGDTLSVNAGCNTLSSTYEIADSTLKWTGVPAATMMACDPALEAQDAWITGLLTKGMDAEGIDGGTTLTLTSGDVEITLDAVADSPLTGTTWTLQSTTANDAASSLPADATPPTLTIDEDGTASIFAGCNTGSTKVAITDTQLTFGPIALTRMACPGGASQLEAQVVAVLDGKVAYTIDGEQLTIVNGGNGLVYTAS
ncbi:MAG: META domain-containing protein [Aquihabitans sp.]